MESLIFFFTQEPRVVFEEIDATELYPCVTFYSSNPGEKVCELTS